MNLFDNPSWPEDLKKSLSRMNFHTPTPIQEASIPFVLENRDLMASAQTGTGKTGAFAIPMIAKALQNAKSQFLILAPTRELAAQIRDVVLQMTHFSRGLKSVLLVGGSPIGRQLQQLKQGPSIVIGTPGRINDHLKRKSLRLSNCDFVVLDEADRMLDMGFGPQIETILEQLPDTRQTLLFSATFPAAIQKLSRKFLKNPEEIQIGSKEVARKSINQNMVALASSEEKLSAVIDVLKKGRQKTLVFVRTKRGAEKLHQLLEKRGFRSSCIHGDRSQNQREKAISLFRTGRVDLMIATDVASRGLDVKDIELVMNYDLPDTSEDYIHRIGRTGRGDDEGEAISFVTSSEHSHWKYLTNQGGKKLNRQPKKRVRQRRSFQSWRKAS